MAGLFRLLFFFRFFFHLFHLFGFVTKLLETLDERLGLGLVGIVGDGDTLCGDVALYLLHTLLEAQIALNLVHTVVAMHLRLSGYYYGLDVLGQANHCGQHHGTQ